MKLTSLLKFIWLLPATIIVWALYILPLLATKQISFSSRDRYFIWSFEIIAKDNWYARAWSKWAGWSGPCVYLFKKYTRVKYPFLSDQELKIRDSITRDHELEHCEQQFIFGAFYYFVYISNSIWILISNGWRTYDEKRHMYLDNMFERGARRVAGQVVNIPRSQWLDGPDDYNPWL